MRGYICLNNVIYNSCLFTAQVNRRLGLVENYFPAVGMCFTCLTWQNPVLRLHCGGARGIRDPR